MSRVGLAAHYDDMMAGSFQPSRGDIDAFLSLVPDVPESEVVFRLKVTAQILQLYSQLTLVE